MRHVDPDTLALLALGEEVSVPEDSAHLTECDQCRREVELLSRAALVGRSTFDAGDLLDPPARVWSRITDELSFSSESVILSEAAPEITVPAVAAPVVESGNVHQLEKRRRPWVGALAAAASLALVAATGSAIWLGLQPADQPTVLASATLDAFPNWSESTGEAKLERRADGTRIVEVSFSAPPTEGGFREVWLITSDATALVSLGIVEGTSGQFTVPNGLDVDSYNLVDISEEQFDGNPAHSGDSIVRGQLTVGV